MIMRFVSIRQMRENSKELWKWLQEDQEIILTFNGKPVAVMTGIDNNNFEKYLIAIRRAKAAIALEEMQLASVKAGTAKLSLEEINQEITNIRAERKR